MSTAKLRRPKSPRPLILKRHHGDALRRTARLLNVPPQVFADWLLDDIVEGFEEVGGALGDWAVGDLLVFESEDEREMVRRNYMGWLRRKGVEPRPAYAYAHPKPLEPFTIDLDEPGPAEEDEGGAAQP